MVASDGRQATVASGLAGNQCRITTTGRVSGHPHEVTVWFVVVGESLYVLARSADTDWVRNIVAEPAVDVTARRRSVRGTARVVTDEAESRRAQAAWYEKYAARLPTATRWDPAATVVAIERAA